MNNVGDEALGRAVDACQRGDLQTIEQLIENGLSPAAFDADGCSLLHWASINNRVPIVQRLISGGADVNSLGGILKSTPLHWAARVGNLPTCALLVKAGANCNVRDTQGYTPIHLAVQGQHQILVAYLLEKFDYAADMTDNSGMTATMWAAYRSFTMFPLRLLIRKSADINTKEDLQGNTALHLAAQERNYTAVSELISAGADVSVKNKQQETALDIAKNNRNQRIIGMIEEGARQQGVMSRRCSISKRVRKTGEFFLPMVVIALAGCLYQLVHYGIASAILLAVAVFLSCTLKLEMNGAKASLIPIGISVAEPLLMLTMWLVLCTHVHWFVPWWVQIMLPSTLTILFFCLARIFFGDPGVIPPTNDGETFVDIVESLSKENVHLNYCFTCWVDKPPGTKHCSVCDRCVKGFDHHCPWLHQCVTKRNLREFLIFVLCVAVSSGIYLAGTLHLVITEIHDYGFSQVLEDRCFLMMTMVLAGFHALVLSTLFFSQCMQISSHMTTNDRIMMHRRGQLDRPYPTANSSSSTHSHSHSPFSQADGLTCRKRIENILEFCAGRY